MESLLPWRIQGPLFCLYPLCQQEEIKSDNSIKASLSISQMSLKVLLAFLILSIRSPAFKESLNKSPVLENNFPAFRNFSAGPNSLSFFVIRTDSIRNLEYI